MKPKLEIFTPRILCVCTNILAEQKNLFRLMTWLICLSVNLANTSMSVWFTRLLVSVKPVDCELKKETPTDLKPAVTFCPRSVGYLVGVWEICSRKCCYVPRVSIHFHLLKFTERGCRVLGGSHLNSIDFSDVQAEYKMMDHDVFLSTYGERGRKKERKWWVCSHLWRPVHSCAINPIQYICLILWV